MYSNLPKEFTALMREQLGERESEFARAWDNEPVYAGVRVNALKSGARELLTSAGIISEEARIPWCADGYYIDKSVIGGNHPYHIAGLIYFQEPSAMCAAAALPIERGERVLDLCAAPGGKATQAAAMMGGSGLLVANETVPKRAAVLADNIERMGIRNAVVTSESPARLAEKYAGFFNKIIVDAPCSGEGMFRKEPQAADAWSVEHTRSCGVRQQHILDSAYTMLCEGGYIVYSTCTFSKYENEYIAKYMVERYPDITIEPIPCLDMLEPAVAAYAPEVAGLENARRIYPHTQKGEGHFVMLLKKHGGVTNSYTPSAPKRRNVKGRDELAANVKLWREFEREYLNTEFNGRFEMSGERLYLVPEIDLDGIRVLRRGLELGICRKWRFEPSHALALALSGADFKNTVSLSADSDEMRVYLSGNTIAADTRGWTAVLADGYPIGWVKASGGVGKNKFPKYMRRMT